MGNEVKDFFSNPDTKVIIDKVIILGLGFILRDLYDWMKKIIGPNKEKWPIAESKADLLRFLELYPKFLTGEDTPDAFFISIGSYRSTKIDGALKALNLITIKTYRGMPIRLMSLENTRHSPEAIKGKIRDLKKGKLDHLLKGS